MTGKLGKPILCDMENVLIRKVQGSDAQRIADIYNPFITGTTISFEEEPVSAAEIQRRISSVQSQSFPWLCAETNGVFAGYAYATRWRERPAYRYTAESTIYLDPAFSSQGIGRQLYSTLIDELRKAGMHAVIGVITIPNPASVTLHEKLGFTKVAHFSEVGYKFSRWLDVGYWQLMLKISMNFNT